MAFSRSDVLKMRIVIPVLIIFSYRGSENIQYKVSLKQLFTWLSLVVSFMASFVLSFFPLDVLDGIWDLIESNSEGFLTYS